jgi:hypothetical protein
VPIELSWLIPDKILLCRWIGDISGEDVRVLVEELGIVLDGAAYPIHTVIDLSEVRQVSFEAAYAYLQSSIPRHVRQGQTGIVRSNIEGEIVADLANRISRRELVRTFDTRDEASQFLLDHDNPPPPLQPGSDLPTHSSSIEP